MGKAIFLLSLALFLVWFKESTGQTTERDQSTTTEDPKPCGYFPWDSDDVTVDCDYSYHETRNPMSDWLEFLGRCNVICPEEADMLVGPPYGYFPVYSHGAYYCNRDNRTWLGTEPVCLGQYNNATMVTDESNTIRLVGGEFYGCVEMYDDVTDQWGPVRGWDRSGWNPHKMDWVDLVCKNLGFPAGLATSAYRLREGTGVVDTRYSYIIDLHSWYQPSYPSTVPKFIVSDYPPTTDSVTLHGAIDNVFRGPCPSNDHSCGDSSTMCLACAGQQNIDNSQDSKPCGDFPWDSDDVIVDCDYNYHEIRRHGWWPELTYEFLGRCNVTCPKEAEMLVGPPYFDFHNALIIYEGAYFCNRDNRTWLGTQPVCLGQYNNATMVTDDTNTIRLVGGEFYGCVEMYDNVTNQWGPVRGWAWHPQKMGWTDLVCKDLGFPAGLATSAYVLIEGTGVVDRQYRYLETLSVHYDPSYPSIDTTPKFIVSDNIPTAEGSTLHDAIDHVVRGWCPTHDWDCSWEYLTMCLACAGQQNKNNLQVSDINAQVTCTSDSILVSFLRPADNSIQKADVQLAAPPCSAEENSTHIYIQAPLTGCGTNRQDTEDDIIYSNTLTINVNASNAIVTRHHVKVISIECRLPRRNTVAVNFDPQSSSVFRSHIVGRGDFAISMELYLSNSFRFPVSAYPLSAELGQMLYVQVQVTSDDKNLQVFADTCMATPTEDPNDSTVLYHLIREGCDEDSTVARYWSPSTMEERFGFQAFAFTSGARKVYLHCDVLLCNATDPNSRCAQGCQAGGRFAREAEGDTGAYLLIQGPIVLNDDQTVRDAASTGHVVSMVPFFIGACAVIVVAMLFGI